MAKKERSGFWDYKIPTDMDGPERAADFLNWAAKAFPSRPISAEHITRVALHLKNLPREESVEVELFRSSKMGRVRAILLKEYRRALIYHPGMGWRASIDSEDVVVNELEGRRKRVQSAIKNFRTARDLVKENEIKDKNIKSRFQQLDEALERLESPQIKLRLAAPAEDTEKKEDKKKP